MERFRPSKKEREENERTLKEDEPFAKPARQTEGFGNIEAINQFNYLVNKYGIKQSTKELIALHLQRKEDEEALAVFLERAETDSIEQEDKENLSTVLTYLAQHQKAAEQIKFEL